MPSSPNLPPPRNDTAVFMDEARVLIPNSEINSAGSIIVYRQLLKQIAWNFSFHLFDLARITFPIVALLGKTLREIFDLKNYDLEPSESIQKTWLGFIILGISLLAAIIAKTVNYYHPHFAAQDVIFNIFSGVYLIYALDLISSSGSISPIPIGWLIAIIALGLPGLVLFFSKFKSSDSGEQIIFSLEDLNRLNPARFNTQSKIINGINAVDAMKRAFDAMFSLAWTIIREVIGKTMPLDTWIMGLIALMLVPAGKIGYEASNHPKCYHVYAASTKFVKEISLDYYTYSGIFYLIAVFSWCDEKTFCLDDHSRTTLSYASFFMSGTLALFAAATTQIDFKKRYDKNVALEKIISSVPGKTYSAAQYVAGGCRAAISNANAYCKFLYYRISDCCKRDQGVDYRPI